MRSETGKIGVTPLGSGSSGNAFVIHTGSENFMIDAGFSRRELVSRLAQIDVAPESIAAVLITHEHTDHVKGCRVFCNEFGIAAYLTEPTANYLRRKTQLPEKIRLFEPGSSFRIGAAEVLPFALSHDAVDPVGFRITVATDFRIALATDLGELNLLATSRLSDVDVLVIESNYDCRMLLESPRSPELKHRIMGRSGHLDNRNTLAALDGLLTARTKALLLAHVSSECNDRRLLAELLTARLRELSREDLIVSVLAQAHPDAGFCIGGADGWK